MRYLLAVLLTLILLPSSVLAAKPTPSPTPSPVKSVCIDPGHGGSDSGATYNGLTEKDLNLDIANRLNSLLTTTGYVVYQTRTTDVTLSNADRYNFCNNKKAGILVSIHHNGSTDHSIDYSQALYAKRSDVDLANVIVNAISLGLGTTNNGITRFASGVILKADMPAIISEGYFLSSDYEQSLLNSTTVDRRQDEARALLNGINNYFTLHP